MYVKDKSSFFQDTNPPPAVKTVEVRTEMKKPANIKTKYELKSEKVVVVSEDKGGGESGTGCADKQANPAGPEVQTASSGENEDSEISRFVNTCSSLIFLHCFLGDTCEPTVITLYMEQVKHRQSVAMWSILSDNTYNYKGHRILQDRTLSAYSYT